MICKITWTNPEASELTQHTVDFTLKDYYLSYDNTSGFLNCTLLYHFNHEDEVQFEDAILQRNCHIENVELIINDLVSHNYSQFNGVASYVHSLNTMDGTPTIVLQMR